MAWRLGRKIRLFLGSSVQFFSMELFLDFGLGTLLLLLFWMGLGLTGLWFEGLWAMVTLTACLWVAWDLRPLIRKITQEPLPKIQLTGPSLVLLFLTVLYLIVLGAHSLLPETFYDSLNYFLGMPQAWLNRHGICDLPTQMLSGYFHGGSLFFMNSLIAGGTEGAKVLNAMVLVLCAGVVWTWMREWGEKEGALFATFWTLTFPLFFINSWAVRVDGLVTLLTLLVFYCLSHVFMTSQQNEGKEEFWVLTACLLAGAAIAVKPTALMGLAAVSGFLLVVRGPRWFLRPRHWVYAAAGFLIFTSPWLLKNWAYAGNPLFPYASAIFGGRSLTPDHYARLLGENHQFLPMDQGLMSYLSLPWRLTMPQEGDTQFLGPLILAFLPLALLTKLTENRWKKFGWLTALYLVLGLCSTHMLRFLMPGFLMLFMLVGKAVAQSGSWVRKSAWFALGLSAVLNLGSYTLLSARYFDGMGVWSGRENRESYLDRKMINSYKPLTRWCQNLPADSGVLVVGDARGLYYPRPFLANSAFDVPFFEAAAREERDTQGILERMKRSGIDAVVMNLPEGMRLSQQYGLYHLTHAEWAKLNSFFNEGLKPLFITPTLQAYLVNDSPQTITARAPFDPFSCFNSTAYDFSQALQSGNLKKAESLKPELLSLFPGEPYWTEQASRLDKMEAEAKKNQKGTKR